MLNVQMGQDRPKKFIRAAEALRGKIMSCFVWGRRFRIPMMLVLLMLELITGCQASQSADAPPPTATAAPQTSADAPAVSSSGAATPTPCANAPIVVPTAPAISPGYTQLDVATNLHVTGTAQKIDPESYRLEITGKVTHPLKLRYDDLRCLPKLAASPPLICPGFFKDIAPWAGASLKAVLELAGVEAGAQGIKLVSADGYSSQIPLAEALAEKNFLAYEWQGEPLPILHGFPVRAVFPELDGNKWVKWLVKIEVY